MKGSEGIPSLKLETLNKLISKMDKAPDMFFSNLFPTVQYDSDTIRWEIEYGSAGMTPFVAPGTVAPAVGVDGTGEASAKAAFYKEKMYFDEEFLNNMREPGSWATYQAAERKLARGTKKLDYRIQRRREWMMAQMFIEGGFTYMQKGGAKFTVNYGIPSTHKVTLTGNDCWDVVHADSDPVEDIFDAKRILSDDAGVSGLIAMCNSEVLKVLMFKKSVQDLLSKSAFGNGDLFAQPAQVIGNLLGVGPLAIYDDLYEVPAYLTGNVIGGVTTAILVDDASDFVVGGTLRFYDMSKVNSWEDCVIAGVAVETGTVTVATAPTFSYIAGEDKVTMKKKFIGDDKFFMFSTSQDGEKVAEFMEAPYGNTRRWGKFADTKDEWDPEGMWLRIQDKGLPVLYHPDTTFTYTVK